MSTLSRKALPTVSVSNTNVNAFINNFNSINSLPQNFIPFPSSSSPLDSDISDSDCTSLLRCTPRNSRSSPRTTSISQVELRHHRRSIARLAQSPLLRKDSKVKPKNLPPPPPSSSSITATATAGRRPRPRKHDVQLLETVYRSVASRLARCRADTDQVVDSEMNDLMEAQDRLFVDRLCGAMVELGYPPLPMVFASDQDLSSSTDSPFLCDPLPSLVSVTPISLADRTVLTMPQLVATIMLRRRERARKAASRERSAHVRKGSMNPKSSPLSRDVS
jgi:hypothetical protein